MIAWVVVAASVWVWQAGPAAAPAWAQDPVTVDGAVKGRAGEPKPGVLVDVLGPRRVFTRTDDAGRFSVALPPGLYTIRVREGGRRQRFPLDVAAGGGGPIRPEFQVGW